MKKSAKALLEVKHKIILDLPDIVVTEFHQAAEDLQRKYSCHLSVELLMSWLLTGFSKEFIMQEFDRIVVQENAKGNIVTEDS
jgi:hypothetical protein